MKRNIDIDLKADIWNLLEELQKRTPQQVYESQEFYLESLRLLFNNQFRQKIKALREHLEVPLNWYSYPQNIEPHYKHLFELKEKHPDAPQREFDEVIVDLCGDFGLNPLRYGWFVLYYLYYANLSVGIERAEGLIAKAEFRRKARIIIKRNDYSSKDKSFEKPHQRVGYIQFYKDTTPKGIEEFIKDNMQTIIAIKKRLTPYPYQPDRKRGEEVFKRDIEIFLLAQLDFKDNQISSILQNTPKIQEQELMDKSFEELTDGKITLLQRKYPITKRKAENTHEIEAGNVRKIISNLNEKILK